MLNTTVELITTPYHVNNRPGSLALLRSSATAISSFTIDCLPLTGPIQITVAKSDATNIDTASYAILKYEGDENTYVAYIIPPRVPVSPGVYTLNLECDGFLTCQNKGITKIEGITERVHVPKSDDTFGAFIEDDPYLGCAEPLEVEEELKFTGSGYNGDDAYRIVAANVDLNLLGLDLYTRAFTTSDNVTSKTATYPVAPAIRTTYTSSGGATYDTTSKKQTMTVPVDTGGATFSYSEFNVPDVDYFDSSVQSVNDGMTKAHSLGLDDGIIAQYSIPKNFIGTSPAHSQGRYSKVAGGDFNLTGAHDSSATVDSALDFIYDNTVQNKRLLCGDMNKYGLTAIATGENVEVRPEDLRGNSAIACPTVELFVDPRENGCPMFKFSAINGRSDMWRGLVSGMKWQNVPLTNMYQAGWEKSSMMWKNEGVMQDYKRDTDMWKSFIGTASGGVSSKTSWRNSDSMGMSSNFFSGGGRQDFVSQGSQNQMGSNLAVNGLGMALGFISNIANGALDTSYASKQRQYEANMIVLDNILTAPTMRFPTVPSLREAVGNGVLVYRYHPTSKDLARLDKILNMYGYRVTKTLELSDFSNRSRYNYVKASGVHITCDLPSYIVEKAEADIMAGIRVWHVPYDGNYTTVNS